MLRENQPQKNFSLLQETLKIKTLTVTVVITILATILIVSNSNAKDFICESKGASSGYRVEFEGVSKKSKDIAHQSQARVFYKQQGDESLLGTFSCHTITPKGPKGRDLPQSYLECKSHEESGEAITVYHTTGDVLKKTYARVAKEEDGAEVLLEESMCEKTSGKMN